MNDSDTIVFGVPGSGTTYIWQIIRELFPATEVKHVHNFYPEKDNRKIVVCIRDFRECLATMIRHNREKSKADILFSEQEVTYHLDYILTTVKELDTFCNRENINALVLRYDRFDEDNYLMNNISSYFQIDISQPERERILEQYSKAANILLSEKYKDFTEYDPQFHIHGNHIYTGNKGWREMLLPGLQKLVNTTLQLHLIQYGYEP